MIFLLSIMGLFTRESNIESSLNDNNINSFKKIDSIKAQIKYEKGYFISNNDSKTECLIYNMDWSINPVEFIYKSTEDAKPLTIGIQDVKKQS